MYGKLLRGAYGTVHRFDNGNTQTTILMCNEPDCLVETKLNDLRLDYEVMF